MKKLSPVIRDRLAKAQKLREMGVNLYPTGIKPDICISKLREKYENMSAKELEKEDKKYAVAGRIMIIRSFGKASFLEIKDGTGRIQIYIKKDKVGDKKYKIFKLMDAGDFIWVKGPVFRTKTDELTIMVEELELLCKSLRPLPEKWHGLTDVEIRYRQRYLDLMVNDEVKRVFVLRSKIIHSIREFFVKKGFLEVETPMMQPIPGGATARPFKTYHNALGMELYLRIAPELYLKRLVVGGMDKVFELNRNFRNEGISTHHNPEFTMLEFYMAYATYEDLMKLTEELFLSILDKLFDGKREIEYQGNKIDFTSPWRRIALFDALRDIAGIPEEVLKDEQAAKRFAESHGINILERDTHGKILTKIFDHFVEPKLINPTFVVGYPIDVSPLSRRNDKNPDVADRFELFIGGMEVANGFNELNDPVDQKKRFEMQVALREAGDEEAQFMDEDYITALEHGLPPTAGEGIGIDRMVMLLTDSPSIRDVILFPHMKPKQ